jgi:transcription elongation GreA/GreB family factor
MSRAFVRDDDGGEGIENLPDRLVSEHPNLVTRRGLELIAAEVQRLNSDYSAAQASGDRNTLQKSARDLRYWSGRQASAIVRQPPDNTERVQFGHAVTVLRSDGRQQTWRIVGEDEADPSAGSVSYVSPIAQAVLGKQVGDEVGVGSQKLEIQGIIV